MRLEGGKDMALAMSGALPGGRPWRETIVSSSSPTSLHYTILLSSDANVVDKCVDTIRSLRDQQYTGDISYVTEVEELSDNASSSFAAMNVSVRDLKTILEQANPGSSDAQWADASLTPPHCDFEAAYTAASPPRVGDYSWGPPLTYAKKRATGWRGYYWKTLAAFTSYWRDVEKFDRILWLDCGATAMDGPIEQFFTAIDSTDRLVAQSDYAIFAKDLRDGCERSCNVSAYDGLWGNYDKLVSDDNEVQSFNSAMMLYDTSITGHNNERLRELTRLFAAPIARIVGGDQEILNFELGPLSGNKWTNIPEQRPDAAAGSCFYSYFSKDQFAPTTCTSYLVVKSVVEDDATSP